MKKEKTYPKHIGIILDGNRRWAKEREKKPWDGHLAGFKKIQELKKWMIELKIKEMTLYCFSIQNFSRDKKEVFFLMKIFEKAFADIIRDPDIYKNKVKINHIGRIQMLPKKLQKIINNAQEKTKNHNNYKVNFALAYGGQEEIIDAIKKAYEQKINFNNLTPKKFESFLYNSSVPDIIIRTSGEVRTSNFLVWQQAYSEWFFPKKYWPEFSKKDLKNIIDKYLGRERRYGK